jgi:hypothetical protein
MSRLLAVLSYTDFAVIALIVFVFVTAASSDLRKRLGSRRIERKLDALLQHHGIVLPARLSPEVQALALQPGQKIAAIKLHREQTGASLAQAKAEVEEFSD